MKVPYYDLKLEYEDLRNEIQEALDRACRKSAFILGEEVEHLEREFAAFCEVKYCVALNSGTSALHLGLIALGVQPGDEVITSPNTFIATAEAISYCGAKPVFVDIDPSTANIDPERIEQAITPRTKTILPVHLYGRPAAMDAIEEIARRRHISVLEDACQAHGACYRGRCVGGLGRAAAFSFYPSKNLGAYGEGGALTTNSDRLAQYARAARSHGQSRRYEHDFIGYNYRMDGFQGAILRIKLRRLQEWNDRRRTIAEEYRGRLQGARVELLHDDPRDECVHHLFPVYVANRDRVRQELEARGIDTAIHYPKPLHLQPAYAHLGYTPGAFPNAERACERVMNLPIFPRMTDEQVAAVSDALRDITETTNTAAM